MVSAASLTALFPLTSFRRSPVGRRPTCSSQMSRSQSSSKAEDGDGALLRIRVPNRKRDPTLSTEKLISPLTSAILLDRIEKFVSFKRFKEALELLDLCPAGTCLGADTYAALVNAAAAFRSVSAVKSVLRHMYDAAGFEPGLQMMNRILLALVRSGMIGDARRIFYEMPDKSVVSWNIMISGLLDSGFYKEAFNIFLQMWVDSSDKADPPLLATVICASMAMGDLFTGLQIHSCVVKLGFYGQDVYLSCALINMYSKCGRITEAQWVFDEISVRTTVVWNSIIAAYALHGYSEKALDLYHEMQGLGVTMDQFTFSIVIGICSRLGSMEHARQAHARLLRNGLGLDLVASTSLIDFYGKWGRMENVWKLFEAMPRKKNLISWNALLGGYANHGMGHEAIVVFDRMIKEGMAPNHITFLAILTACSSSGLSIKGREIFDSMNRVHKVMPRAMHYARMIEFLGREGRLDEALALIHATPFKPTMNMWAALLTACRVHKNLQLGRFAAEKLYGMDPEKLSNYMVLLNIYNSVGLADKAIRVVESLKNKGLRLRSACTWIEIKRQCYKFISGDRSHPQSNEIYAKLNEILKDEQERLYVGQVLPDVVAGEEEHEDKHISNAVRKFKCRHSEELAVSFGILSTPETMALRLVQGHRICDHCHAVMKLIAKVSRREVVVRDAGRFHHFNISGRCSCGDYW